MGFWGVPYLTPPCQLPNSLLRDVVRTLPPLYLSCPLRSPKRLNLNPPLPQLRGHTAQEAPSLTIFQALEVAILTNMVPLHLNVGGITRVYKCWVEGFSEGPSTSHAAICTQVHWVHLGVRLGCPSCSQTFLNSDALRHHKKKIHT